MARKNARFRIPMKDNTSREALKIELIPGLARNRFCIRQNGRMAEQLPDANLTLILGRLRRWLVLRVNNYPRHFRLNPRESPAVIIRPLLSDLEVFSFITSFPESAYI